MFRAALILSLLMFFSVLAVASEAPKTDIFSRLAVDAEKGDPAAQGALGHIYRITSAPEAGKWLRMAAEQGNVDAQAELGGLYFEGCCGVKQDYAEAYFWNSLAAAYYDAFANPYIYANYVSARDVAKEHLTSAQKTQVEKRVQAWKPKESPDYAEKYRAYCAQKMAEYIKVKGVSEAGADLKKNELCIGQCAKQFRNTDPLPSSFCPSDYPVNIELAPVVPH